MGKEEKQKRPASAYAKKSRLPLEATHERHQPPVARCQRCNPTQPGYEHYDNALPNRTTATYR